MTPRELMPAAFIGHGNPMNALETNRYTQAWHAFGRAVPRPRAILVVSAHWYINATAVTAMPRPRTIHDFYGFPPELFAVQYPAPGLPELAAEISDAVHPTWVGADIDSWGIDHGTWSVLVHAFPDADIPVVQLSINADKDFDYHLDLGARLASLRRSGVLVVASGNVVHNLRGMSWDLADSGYDWAQRFDEDAKARMLDDPVAVTRLDGHRDFANAVPTPDHFLPLLYLAGLASAGGEGADILVDGYTYGSLSMTAYTIGMACPEASGEAEAAARRRRTRRPAGHRTRDRTSRLYAMESGFMRSGEASGCLRCGNDLTERRAATQRNVFRRLTAPVRGSWNWASAGRRASRTACWPAASAARAPPAEQSRARTASSMSAYRQWQTTSPLPSRVRPADTRDDSRLPGAERA